ncbi:MAG: PAC2 family protein [Candidatus Thermoplasmatota archaeon]|nr:PAC2 family protein [Candidatus Thermoplasmatota archaeon]MCL5963464.1 PAC2 family protein [Candidatus Thermoplasmatota archaeon]
MGISEKDIEIYEMKKMDLSDAIILDGFPSVGLVSSIVANYLVNVLDMVQIGVMESNYFPAVSLIRDSEPLNPVRIYATINYENNGHKIIKDKIIAFISEFQPQQTILRAIANKMLNWATENKCALIVSPQGLTAEEPNKALDTRIYGIASTRRAKELFIEPNVAIFTDGVINGVTGVLLNEGKRRNYDVITFLSEAHQDYPDARASAKLIEVINNVLLKTKVDAEPLFEEAAKIEMQIKAIQKQTTSQIKESNKTTLMYS